jgi:hypothetical protein
MASHHSSVTLFTNMTACSVSLSLSFFQRFGGERFGDMVFLLDISWTSENNSLNLSALGER